MIICPNTLGLKNALYEIPNRLKISIGINIVMGTVSNYHNLPAIQFSLIYQSLHFSLSTTPLTLEQETPSLEITTKSPLFQFLKDMQCASIVKTYTPLKCLNVKNRNLFSFIYFAFMHLLCFFFFFLTYCCL